MNAPGLNYLITRSPISLLIVLLFLSCATPTSPTGGPRDEEGPVITKTYPESGTTNFKGDKIELAFSEWVDRASLKQAVRIEPDIGIGFSLDWGRKSVEIEFDRELPDLTTVIVKIGTDLTDTRNNKLAEPVSIAVSTGPEIDRGEIAGRVIDSQTGKGTSGDRIFLYRAPASLDQRADYTAETDTSGRFLFSYLRQGEYKVFWVNDQNRSKIWEQERERAQPFQRETVTLEKEGKDTLRTLYKALPDTTKPELQGVGLFSSRRIRMRFSENIRLTDSSSFAVNDTLGNRYADVIPYYISPKEKYVLFAQSEEVLSAENTFQLAVNNVSDMADNLNPEMRLRFDGSSQEDTTTQRIVKWVHPAGLFPDEPLEIVYASSITQEEVLDSLQVVEGNELAEGWENLVVEQNQLKVAPPAPGTWQQALDYEIRVWNPATESRRSHALNVWHPVDFGRIEFAIADTTDKRPYTLYLQTEERGRMVDSTFSGSIEVGELPPVEFQAIIFSDVNGNGRWDPGRVVPFEAPEPYYIRNKIPVRKGFTGEVDVSFE